MKLNELFSPQIKTIHAPDVETSGKAKHLDPEDEVGDDVKQTPVGHEGLYATAQERSDRPGEITKTAKLSRSDINDDAYLQFIKAIVNNERLQSNPYLPKIYGVRVYKKDDAYIYKVNMEKLYPLDELSEDELKMIADRALHISSSASRDTRDELGYEDKRGTGERNKGGRTEKYMALKRLRAIIDTIFNSLDYKKPRGDIEIEDHGPLDNTVNIKDPKLKQAIMIIKKIIKGGAINDIHVGNMMVRRTSVGPQLVIIDPVAHL